MRMEAKPHVAAHLAYNVRGDGVLSRCTTNLLSATSVHAAAAAFSLSRSLCLSKSEALQTPAPAPSTTHIPRLRRATPPMSSTPLGGLPFCLLSRSGTKAALSCTLSLR